MSTCRDPPRNSWATFQQQLEQLFFRLHGRRGQLEQLEKSKGSEIRSGTWINDVLYLGIDFSCVRRELSNSLIFFFLEKKPRRRRGNEAFREFWSYWKRKTDKVGRERTGWGLVTESGQEGCWKKFFSVFRIFSFSATARGTSHGRTHVDAWLVDSLFNNFRDAASGVPMVIYELLVLLVISVSITGAGTRLIVSESFVVFIQKDRRS